MRLHCGVALAITLLATPATAAVQVLGFEGISAVYPTTTPAQILGFYAGGASSQGKVGPAWGMTFAPNAVALCLNGLGGSCSSASRGGLEPTSARGALAFSGTATWLDIPAGYTGMIGFRWAIDGTAPAGIAAFDGPAGTGTQLAFVPLFASAAGCPAYNAMLCPLSPGGLGFVTGAKSLLFAGLGGHVVFDDITFGAGNDPLPPPATVPEPQSWALLLAGFALAGRALRRRRVAGVQLNAAGMRLVGDSPVSLPRSQEEMGRMANLSRDPIGQIPRAPARHGLIANRYGSIRFELPAALRHVAEGAPGYL